MKVQELVEFVGNSKNKLLKTEQLQEVIKKEIKTKDYMSIKEKKELIEDIVNECVLYEDGVYKFDDIDKYICFTMKTIEAYTDIELSNDIEADYDILCCAKILNLIINTFKTEYDDVNVLLQMKCEYILSGNNFEAQVGKFLSGLSDKFDVLVSALAEKVGDFNFDDLPVSRDDLDKLMSFINIEK